MSDTPSYVQHDHDSDKKRSGAAFSLQLTVKQVFVAGVAVGVLGLAAVGFVYMLATGGSFATTGNGGDNPFADAVQVPDSPDRKVGDVAPVAGDDHIRGEKNAPITLIEYSDFQCPFCSRFHPTMIQVLNDYKGKVRWVYRHFPLRSIHPDAQKSAEASECAGEQGKFWEMADKMFEKQGEGLAVAQLSTYAREAGVRDIKKFDACLSSGKYADRVSKDLASGEKAGVTGTPGTIIIDKDGSKELIPGALPYDSIKTLVEQMLAS